MKTPGLTATGRGYLAVAQREKRDSKGGIATMCAGKTSKISVEEIADD